jgi:hypothetical protein
MRNEIKLLVGSFIISIFIWNHAFARGVPIESLLPENIQKMETDWQSRLHQKRPFNRINGQAEL